MSATSRSRRPVPVVLIALGIGFAMPSEAGAHAAFVGASPSPGARAQVAPRDVQLRFTEPLNRRLTSVRLVAVGSGRRIDAGLRAAGASRVSIRPQRSLAMGAYRVEWHTVSTLDGHALEGTFSFGVRAPAAGSTYLVQQSPLARDGWIRIALRVLLYTGALLFAGAVLLPHLVGGAPSWLTPSTLRDAQTAAAVRRRAESVVECVGWLAVVAAVGATLAETADAAQSLSPTALGDYLLANDAGVARLAVVGLLAIAALAWRRLPGASAVLVALALGAIAASGHASSASPRLPSVLNDWLHLLGAAAWMGGTGLVALAWAGPLRRGGRELRTDVARRVLVPFGRVALPAFVLVSATGVVSLITQLGYVSALWETDYGRLLALKIAVVGVIAAISAVHAWRLRPRLLANRRGPGDERTERRHWRLVRSEPVLGLGVVAVVGALAAFPLPPRQLGEAGAARASALVCDPCPLSRPAADELPVATQAGSQLVAAWIRRTPAAVTGRLRVLDVRGRPSPAPLRSPDAALSACGRGCARFRAAVDIRTLRITVRERGRSRTARLPTLWQRRAGPRARRLLLAAQAAMRDLRGVRQSEQVSSGPGSHARTDYRLRAPDRLAFRTDRGVQTVIAGRRQWLRTSGSPWQRSEYGGGLPFRTRNWFRWSTYGRTVRLLREGRRGGRRLAEIALFDEGTPVWFRLTIDLTSRRVLREQMTARGHFMTARYSAFDQPLTIELPLPARGS